MTIQNGKTLGVFSTYYLKPGQTIQNTKVSERSLAMIAPNSVYNRFLNYTIEEKKAAIIAEEEAKRLTQINENKNEMSKEWGDKLKSIRKQQEERKLLKEKEDEIARNKFVKEMKEKKELDRAKVLQQAKRLLLYRQPQCRIINAALLTSECIKELNAQREFEMYLKEIEKKQQIEYQSSVQNDIEKFKSEERKKIEERVNMKKRYREELLKQIDDIKKNTELLDQKERTSEKDDLQKMTRELELIKSAEEKLNKDKKVKLKRLFTEALEEKAMHKKQQQINDEMQDQARQIYAESKHKIQKMLKLKQEEERKKFSERVDLLARIIKSEKRGIDLEEEEQRRIKYQKEIELAEEEKMKMEVKKKTKMKEDIENYLRQDKEIRRKRLKEEENFKLWEILERMKKNKFDKNVHLQEHERKVKNKKKYAEELHKQILEKNEKEVESKEKSSTILTSDILEFTNKKILSYGDEVIKESTGVRPLFPIIKAVEQVKKEIGIKTPKKYDEPETPPVIKKKKGKPSYMKNLQESQIYYFG